MDVEQLFDIGQWIALLGLLISPPLISLVKNVGRNWSDGAKGALAMTFAVVGALVAYTQSGVDLSEVSLTDVDGFWFPLLFDVAGMVGAQYASYKTMWSTFLAPVNDVLAGVGQPKNPGE